MAEQQQDLVQQRFYMQINYLVMRTMWQAIRKRAKNNSTGQTIYDAFHMSRERYTRIIRGQKIRLSEEELRRLVSETGVRREIFEGKAYFQFDAISEKDWKKLFDLRNMDDIQGKTKAENLEGKSEEETEKIERRRKERIKTEQKNKRKDARDYEKYLYKQMNQSDIDLLKNPDLYCFAVYLKRGRPETDIDIETALKERIKLLNSVSFSQLERCRSEVLQEYLQVLKNQMDIAETLLKYIQLKQQRT